ncbi:hypothetical protein NEOC95_001039 [Neochlamydia sp. AcF95]|nr:hypothetical protein [Neochlamydia sp. AcF95]
MFFCLKSYFSFKLDFTLTFNLKILLAHFFLAFAFSWQEKTV